MRLWHKDLISYLPNKQLISQWRELSAIIGSIQKHGTPRHGLVNKILDYDKSHFYTYYLHVKLELEIREIKITRVVSNKIRSYVNIMEMEVIESTKLFDGWHNDRYLKQCLYNLQEKYDCGLITEEEWARIYDNLIFPNQL